MPFKTVSFTELPVKSEVAVLNVHDDRMAELCKVEAHLVHASSCHPRTHQSRLSVLSFHSIMRQG